MQKQPHLHKSKRCAAVVTFNRLQVIHGEFEALATSDHPHRVPLIIIEARPSKDGLRAFTYT